MAKQENEENGYVETLAAQVAYYSQVDFEDQETILAVVIGKRNLHMGFKREYLVSRVYPEHDFNIIPEHGDKYSKYDIDLRSPMLILSETICDIYDVVEMSEFEYEFMVTGYYSATFNRVDIHSIIGNEIELMISKILASWNVIETENAIKNVQENSLSEISNELLIQLPEELKLEIISFIQTFTKPERIKLMERNVRSTCKELNISEDEFYNQYCEENCNLRMIEKKLNPKCLQRVDRKFMTLMKMRLINREFAMRMKKQIMEIDTLELFEDDFGKRKYIRAAIELARRDFVKDESKNPLLTLYHFPSIDQYLLPKIDIKDPIACAPFINTVSQYMFPKSLKEYGLKEVEIPFIGKIDFNTERTELKLFLPTFRIEEFENLLDFALERIDIYCLYIDERVMELITKNFGDNMQITLHKRNFCKRAIFNEEDGPILELNLFEIEEYHPLMPSFVTSDIHFFNMDLNNMKKLMDSIYKHCHALFEDETSEAYSLRSMPNYCRTDIPKHLKQYAYYLCSTIQREELSFRRIFDPIIEKNSKRALDIIRNSFIFGDGATCAAIDAEEIFKNDQELITYFYRPYLTYENKYRLIFMNFYTFEDLEHLGEIELSYQDDDGWTVMHFFAKGELEAEFEYVDRDLIAEKLESYPRLLSICDKNGKVPSEIEGGGQSFLLDFIKNNDITINPAISFTSYERPAKIKKLC